MIFIYPDSFPLRINNSFVFLAFIRNSGEVSFFLSTEKHPIWLIYPSLPFRSFFSVQLNCKKLETDLFEAGCSFSPEIVLRSNITAFIQVKISENLGWLVHLEQYILLLENSMCNKCEEQFVVLTTWKMCRASGFPAVVRS